MKKNIVITLMHYSPNNWKLCTVETKLVIEVEGDGRKINSWNNCRTQLPLNINNLCVSNLNSFFTTFKITKIISNVTKPVTPYLFI